MWPESHGWWLLRALGIAFASQYRVSLDLQLVSQPLPSRAEQALHAAPLRETIDTVLHLGLKYFGLEVGTFSEVSGDSLVVHSRRSDAVLPSRVMGPPGLATEQVFAIHDASEGPGIGCRRLRELGHAAYIGTPLVFEGKTVGVLEFTARAGRLPYVASDLDMIASLGRWLESELVQAIDGSREAMPSSVAPPPGRSSGSFFVRDVRASLHDALTEEQQESLRVVHESGRHVLSLVNDILDIARIDAGELDLSLSRCAVTLPSEAALAYAGEMAARKNVRLFSAVDCNIDDIRVDRERFTQVVSTLVANAVRLAGEGGNVGVDVQADEKTQTVSYSVWDDGKSLSQGDIAKLFTPFSEVDAAMSQPGASLGVGLSLVYRIADLHHGSLSVSCPRHGNRFTVTIPNERAAPPASVRSAWQNLLVLLSDPNGSLRAAAEPWLKSRGHRVLYARSHEEAFDQAQMFRPDVVLMDVTATNPGCIDTLKRIRAARDIALATLPVVATSALCLPGDANKFCAAGATEYLRRPLPMRNVIALVERHGPFAKAG